MQLAHAAAFLCDLSGRRPEKLKRETLWTDENRERDSASHKLKSAV
jgi:hypothetical protein